MVKLIILFYGNGVVTGDGSVVTGDGSSLPPFMTEIIYLCYKFFKRIAVKKVIYMSRTART